MIQVQNYSARVLNEGNKAPITHEVVIANDAVIHWGTFCDPYGNTDGVLAYADGQNVRGVVTDILTYTSSGYVSVAELIDKGASVRSGTSYTALTNTENAKYTTSSDNESLDNPDIVVFHEININDSVEAFLGDAGTPVAKGTTAASAQINTYIDVEVARPYMLDESTANATATGLTWQIVRAGSSNETVIVKLVNADGSPAA